MTNTTNKKITKRDILNALIAFANGEKLSDELDLNAIREYAEKEITALDKKNEARRDSKSNNAIKELIIETLTALGKPASVSELMSSNQRLVTAVNYSNAKITAALTDLRGEGRVDREIIKRVSYYKLTA